MRQFFKIFFASLLAVFIACFIIALIFIGIAVSATQSDTPVVKAQSVLYIDLSNRVLEQGRDDGPDLPPFTNESAMGLHDMVRAVNAAIGDSSIRALYLHCRGNSMGMAASQEFGNAIDSFRASGKPVFAYADGISQRAYELAHKANYIFIQPGGSLEWGGYLLEIAFFKGALDKLAIQPEIFYAGQFKSATEPFRLTRMSDANRLQLSEFVDDVYSGILLSTAKHRNIDTATLHELANTLSVRSAEEALAAGLIDGVMYDDAVRDTIKAIIGLKKEASLPMISIADYSAARSKLSAKGERIAVIYAEGTIVGGKGSDGEIGGDSYRQLLSKLRTDKKIKAVVLRINSPGGSAVASETIWRELELLKAEKPLVVSMGDYAASGGYYMACVADSVFAQPATLTGSIGVFSIYFDAHNLLGDKLGLTFDAVKTSPYADLGNPARAMTAFEKTIAQKDVDTIYSQFKQRVNNGRQLSSSFVDSIAQGRIWTGRKALELGLVDRLGGLQDAVACAARMAGLETYRIREYPAVLTLWEKLFGTKSDPNTTGTALLEKQLPPQQVSWFRQVKSLADMANQAQASLPFVAVWR